MRIEFVKEHLTFTGEDSPMAKLMLSVMGAIHEFDWALITASPFSALRTRTGYWNALVLWFINVFALEHKRQGVVDNMIKALQFLLLGDTVSFSQLKTYLLFLQSAPAGMMG